VTHHSEFKLRALNSIGSRRRMPWS